MRYASWLFLLPLGLVAQNVGVATQTRVAAPAPQVSAPQSKPEDLASVEGRVADFASSEPLRKVTLVLRRADFNFNGGAIPTSYSSTSDNGGKFAIKYVEPGRYRLTVNRASSVIYQESIAFAKAAPSYKMMIRLVAVDAAGAERLLGEYTFDHRRSLPGPGVL